LDNDSIGDVCDNNSYSPIIEPINNIIDFFKQWEGLFGTNIDDTEYCPYMSDGFDEYIYPSNWLYPGSPGMALTFRLDLPEPCYGNFASPMGEDRSGFYIWGEAI